MSYNTEMKRAWTIFTALLFVFFFLPTAPAGGSADPTHARALESITAAELRREVEFLASPEMQGRDAGTQANSIVADYLAREFQRLGLEPAAADGSYLQSFTMVRSSLGDGNRFSMRRPAGRQPVEGRLQSDFYPSRYSPSAQVSASAVFAGYGITAAEQGYDDYQGLDVRGKVVLAFQGVPGPEEGISPFDESRQGDDFQKLLNAQRHGAAAMVLIHPAARGLRINGRLAWPADPSLQRYLLRFEKEQVRIPALHASQELLEGLLASAGADLEGIRKRIDRDFQPAGLDLPALRAELEVDIRTELLPVHNVLAVMRGAEGPAADEVVVVGAHFDHIGARDGKVYQGADDDASGTAGLIEIAEAMTAEPGLPRRSVLFAAWNAEEKGLLGSRFYVAHPVFPLSATVAMFQMDMIGRNEEVPGGDDFRFRGLEKQSGLENSNAVNVLGYSYSDDLRRLVVRANRRALLKVRFRYDDNPINLLRRSDHWSFLDNGVPSLLFTTGFHPDYHMAGDTPEKLNYPKLENIARLVYLCVRESADAEERPRLDLK